MRDEPRGSGARTAWLDSDAPLPRARFTALCALLACAALLLRLPTLSSRSLWLDETYSAWFAAVPLHDLWTQVPLYETHPPFYYTLLKGWRAWFGRSEAALRSLSVLASVLTVVALPLGARLARLGARAERIALLAALLLALNAASIAFAEQARPYALMALTGTLAVSCASMLLLRLQGLQGLQKPGRRWPWALGLALCAGLTMWLHNTGAFAACGIWTGLAAGLLLAPSGPRRAQVLVVGLAGVGALLVWSPFLPLLVRQSAALAGLSYWIRFKPSNIFAAWTVICGAPVLHYPAALLTLCGFAWLWRHTRAHFWLSGCVLALPIGALAAVSFFVKPLFLSRLFLWLGPLGMVLVALGIAQLAPRWRGPALAVLLALSAWSVWQFYGSRTEDWRGMLAQLQRDAQPGDLVLAFPNEVQMPVAYYLRRGPGAPAVHYLPAPFPAPGLARRYTANAGAPNIAAADLAPLRALLAGHRRVWLIERHADLYDPGGLVLGELGRRLTLVHKTAGNGANIYRYDAMPQTDTRTEYHGAMSKDELTPGAMDALRARFEQQSRKAQAYYNVMHAVRAVAGSDTAADAWMNTALPALDGKTPAQAVSEGREDEMLALARSLTP
jgi:mannosyltransferase